MINLKENSYKGRTMNLSLDDGTELQCKVIDIIEFNSKYYIALVNEDGHRAFMYEYHEEKDSDDFELLNIDNEETFNKVKEIFNKIIDEDEANESADVE
ncbi:DUF1292 domain-containing protein [Clostridium sp. SM-530-WT-3G]|uniref:DUF1292 domain-containing protein n=1 Tax=Clostridium sp. SM-530-WT-3G TaxID=2725303 RepID=UPI00145F5633|nr:DUF1292 domain-containing protein [Clostridium sp. SM-530-WT-3G]NME81665.1 DUF1292 domain-containing protein [Clostridium sp. SM-530-WT-3G]